MLKRYRKIIVPLDGSEFAEQVLPYLKRLTAPTETELFLVHVIEPAQYLAASPRFTPPDIAKLIYEGGEAYVSKQQTSLQAQGYQVKG